MNTSGIPAAPTKVFLLLLVALDVALILAHVFGFYGLNLLDRRWSVGLDGGYPEFVQYAKFVWVVVLLLVAAVTRGTASLVAWIPLFAYLGLDDMLELHERWGSEMELAGDLAPRLGLEPQAVGELLFAGLVALAAVAVLSVAWVASRREIRSIFLDLVVLTALFAVFVVGVDLLHSAVDSPWPTMILGTLEDGGEMLTLSLLTAYLFHIALGGSSPRTLAKVRGHLG
jgi:hypothetical protein